jgi:hypothetical protein
MLDHAGSRTRHFTNKATQQYIIWVGDAAFESFYLHHI